MLRKINHVGHIVKDLEAALGFYKDALGVTPWDLGIVELPSARIAWLPIGDNFIELIEPRGDDGPLVQHLRDKGEGLYHVAILAADFAQEVEKLKSRGFSLFEKQFDFLGHEQSVAWLMPDDVHGMMVELIDQDRLPPGIVSG